MPAPDAAEPHARGILQGFLQNGRGRSTLLLGIFALMLFAAGRGVPDVAHAPPARETGASGTPRFAEPRVGPSATESGPPLPEPTPEAVAVDNLLARYDVLIRLLETRSMDGGAAVVDSALPELRALRVRTYAAARRAVVASTPARER